MCVCGGGEVQKAGTVENELREEVILTKAYTKIQYDDHYDSMKYVNEKR